MNLDKNKIFENYLKNQLDEAGLVNSLDKIQQKEVKMAGVVYTPMEVVEKMIDICKPGPKIKIIEPSCGHGVFLIGLLDYMKNNYKMAGEDLLEWFTRQVDGFDISKNTINETREIVSFYFKKHFDINVSPYEFENLKVSDSLYLKIESEYDLCIGNPPYIRTKNIDKNYLKKLRDSFKTCAMGNVDIYYAFIEKFTDNSKYLCFITPNGFIDNKSGVGVRYLLKNKITHLIDFKDKLVFENIRTYTCIFKASKKHISKTGILYSNDLKEKMTVKLVGDVFSNSNSKTKSTSSNTQVLSGLATLCDKVFIANKNEKGEYVAHFEGEDYKIESEMVLGLFKLTKFKPHDLSTLKYIIYPYDDKREIIKEKTLREKYPLTYKYLGAAREKLEQRDKGKTEKYETWYAYGRKQGLHAPREKEFIAIPQMIGSTCKPYKFGKLKTSKRNSVAFVSGFIVPYNKENKEFCDRLLSDEFISYAKKHGKPWPGKTNSYYSLTVNQVRNF